MGTAADSVSSSLTPTLSRCVAVISAHVFLYHAAALQHAPAHANGRYCTQVGKGMISLPQARPQTSGTHAPNSSKLTFPSRSVSASASSLSVAACSSVSSIVLGVPDPTRKEENTLCARIVVSEPSLANKCNRSRQRQAAAKWRWRTSEGGGRGPPLPPLAAAARCCCSARCCCCCCCCCCSLLLLLGLAAAR